MINWATSGSTSRTSAAYAPRDGAGALVYDNKMWLLGGWNPPDTVNFPRKCNNEVWSSTDGATWTLVKPNTFLDASFDPETDWEGRHTAGYAVHDNKMWIVGGDPLQGHYQFDVWNSTDGATWTHVNAGNPVPWGPRAAAPHGRVRQQDLGDGRPDHCRNSRRRRKRSTTTSGTRPTGSIGPRSRRRARSGRPAARSAATSCSTTGCGSSAAAPTTRPRRRPGITTTTSGVRPTALTGTQVLAAAPWDPRAVPRRGRVRRQDVGHGRLQRHAWREPQGRLVFRGRRELDRGAQHALGSPARRQRVRLRQRPVDGRRQQHAARTSGS